MTHDPDQDNREPTTAGTTRRTILATAAGGFFLAASGPFLPETAIETAAKGGAYGGKLGGRHGKDRRGRDKNHGDGGRKDQNNKGKGDDPGGNYTRGIEFVVSDNGSAASINVEFYVVHDSIDTGQSWEKKDEKAITSANWAQFATIWSDAALWIADHNLIEDNNPSVGTPGVTLGYGGSLHRNGWRGSTVVDQRLSEHQVAPAMTIEGHTFEVQRLADSDDYKRLQLKVS